MVGLSINIGLPIRVPILPRMMGLKYCNLKKGNLSHTGITFSFSFSIFFSEFQAQRNRTLFPKDGGKGQGFSACMFLIEIGKVRAPHQSSVFPTDLITLFCLSKLLQIVKRPLFLRTWLAMVVFHFSMCLLTS